MHKAKYLLRLVLVLVALLVVAGCGGKEREEARLIEEAKQARISERVTRLLKTAQVAQDAANYEEALKAIKGALAVDPQHQEALALQKQILFEQKAAELAKLKELCEQEV